MSTIENFRALLAMWKKDPLFHSDMADTLMMYLAETRNPLYFFEAPDEIRGELLRSLRRFRKTGRLEQVFPHAGIWRDGSHAARGAIATLIEGGLINAGYAQIAPEKPRFVGLEHIGNSDRLGALSNCEPSLLDIWLESVGKQSVAPSETSLHSTIVIRIDCLRREPGNDSDLYRKVPVQSCAVSFDLYGRNQLSFSPSFSLSSIESFAVKRVQRGRNMICELEIDCGQFVGSGAFRDIQVDRYDELAIIWPS